MADFRERDSFNFYVHRPSYTDSSCAPVGEDNIMVELPIGNARERTVARFGEPEDEEELVSAARDAVVRQFERMGYGATGGGGMKALIKGERVITPRDWEERYNLTHGAVFGLSHGLLQLACFRPPRQTGIASLDAKRVEGLHFVGASTRPGNGVPLVLMGVATAFDSIVSEQGVDPGPPAEELRPMAADRPRAEVVHSGGTHAAPAQTQSGAGAPATVPAASAA